MITLRYLRRRGIGMAWRLLVGCAVILITLQIANTFPSLSARDRQASAQLVDRISRQTHSSGAGAHPNNQQLHNSANANFISQIVREKPSNIYQNDARLAGQRHPATVHQRRSRENEFYENIIVHFDLKGAPPKVTYFMELLELVARSGATGILLEWEDMFPWSGRLEIARNGDAYSMSDVRSILSKAKSLDLNVIPLVQTFGHLEWILKLEQFRKYRENDAYPQVVCLGDQEGVALVKEALKQVIDVHKEYGIKYFHIGADEAFEFGVCNKSKEWIRQRSLLGPADEQLLALSHLKDTASYVKNLTGGAIVLAWHDMLKSFDPRIIAELHLAQLIEPVIWDYSEQIVTMPEEGFAALATNFPTVWASSAYKGANFPSAMYIDIRHYETNNYAWIQTKIAQEQKFKFEGIIITGWQRYDHMAAICEILPMGTPSMVLNVQIALMGKVKDQHLSRARAAQVLGCGQFHVGNLDLISNKCNFTGFAVYALFQGSARSTIKYITDELDNNHQIMGWLAPYSRRHNYTQAWYLNQLQFSIESMQMQMSSIEQALRRELTMLFFPSTVDEFIYLAISPTLSRLKELSAEIKRLQQVRTWPRRPFKIVP